MKNKNNAPSIDPISPNIPYYSYDCNNYPTVAPSEFAKLAAKSVDTLTNNMRVNEQRTPQSRADRLRARQKVLDYSVSSTETVILDGKKPKVQTIKRPCNGQVCIVDWLNITFDVATLGDYRRTNEDDDQYMALCQAAVAEVAVLLAKIFGYKFAPVKQNQNGANFYKYSFTFGDNYGKICIGGQRHSVLIMLSGVGCSLAPKGWEYYMYQFLTRKSTIKPKITRIDLAHDDLKGEYLDVHVLDQLETDDLFHCGGAPSSVTHLGEWKHGDPNDNGLTLCLGKRTSGKFTRFYEKGKQLGDKDGKHSKWVRAEVEFKSSDRVIPFDVLKDPSAYFMGAYPVFADLFDYERIVKTEVIQKTAEVTLQHSFDWIKHQAGKYFSYYSTFMSPDEILAIVKSSDPDDVPVRLHLPDEFARQQADLGNLLVSSTLEA